MAWIKLHLHTDERDAYVNTNFVNSVFKAFSVDGTNVSFDGDDYIVVSESVEEVMKAIYEAECGTYAAV